MPGPRQRLTPHCPPPFEKGQQASRAATIEGPSPRDRSFRDLNPVATVLAPLPQPSTPRATAFIYSAAVSAVALLSRHRHLTSPRYFAYKCACLVVLGARGVVGLGRLAGRRERRCGRRRGLLAVRRLGVLCGAWALLGCSGYVCTNQTEKKETTHKRHKQHAIHRRMFNTACTCTPHTTPRRMRRHATHDP
jgi:hypothetical protein